MQLRVLRWTSTSPVGCPGPCPHGSPAEIFRSRRSLRVAHRTALERPGYPGGGNIPGIYPRGVASQSPVDLPSWSGVRTCSIVASGVTLASDRSSRPNSSRRSLVHPATVPETRFRNFHSSSEPQPASEGARGRCPSQPRLGMGGQMAPRPNLTPHLRMSRTGAGLGRRV